MNEKTTTPEDNNKEDVSELEKMYDNAYQQGIRHAIEVVKICYRGMKDDAIPSQAFIIQQLEKLKSK